MNRNFGFGVFTLLMVGLFFGLGVWQLQRRVEKHALIAALTQRLAAAPTPLPPVSEWAALTAVQDEFRRVSFTATYTSLPDAMVYTSGSGLREDISGPGTWAFVPARVPTGGTVVINAGFVPNTMQDRSVQDRAVAGLITNTPAMFTGYIRFPESPSLIAPRPDVGKRLWFNRWPGSMARALAWGRDEPSGDLAPFYIDLEKPVPASGVPKPGPLSVHLRDDHLQYAITWFGLAGAVMIAFAAWWRRGRSVAP